VPEREETVELPRRAPRRPETIPTINDFEMESIRSYDEAVESRRQVEPSARPSDRRDRPAELDATMSTSAWEVAEPREVEAGREARAARRDDWRVDALEDEVDGYDERWDEPALDPLADDAPSGRSMTSQGDIVRSDDADEIRPWGYVEPRRGRSSDVDARESARPAPPSMSKLWDEIPRCCRTCRDFGRPSRAGAAAGARTDGPSGTGGWSTSTS
jgi:hypothetical protein